MITRMFERMMREMDEQLRNPPPNFQLYAWPAGPLPDPRNESAPLVEELRRQGFQFRNALAIHCRYCQSEKPTAQVEIHRGHFRYVCRNSACGAIRDLLQLRAEAAEQN